MHSLVILLFLSMPLWAHQTSLTADGQSLYWPAKQVKLQIIPNSSDLPPATTQSIIQASMAQWNGASSAQISQASSSSTRIYFTSEMDYGSAVIGLTEVSYNALGAISRADIKLNDNYNFTNNQSSMGSGNVYLGDVVTHEMGHLLGLSHSEVLNASMFYTAFPGQSTISSDDRAGIRTKYDGGPGTITGSVRGGSNVGIMGVHVQAISRNTGEVTGVYSSEGGSFTITGLDLNDTYYLYTSPVKNVEALSGGFSNIQAGFCPGSFVGGFFTACGRNNDGYPQPIRLSAATASVNVGVVTINCSLRASDDYSYQKLQSSFSPVTIWESSDSLFERAFIGYFVNVQSWSNWEHLKIDLTGTPVGAGTRTLRLKFLAQPFGNLLQYQMRVEQNLVEIANTDLTLTAPTLTWKTDLSVDIPLGNDPSLNVFDVYLRAQPLPSGILSRTFPSPTLFTSSSHLPYLLIGSVFQGSSSLAITQPLLSDNQTCLDAPFSYHVNTADTLREHSIASNDAVQSPVAASCGTIEPPSQGPGGSMAIVSLGFILVTLASYARKKAKNFLS